MIGTVICRNCDTAIEVSDGDVSRFRASPVFACSVCHHDLSQRMAELIGRGDDPNEEPTVADDDAYDGLPVGETLDQAAERMRAARNPEPTPVMRNPEPTPVMSAPGSAMATGSEDPTTLALRIAQQAQAQAQALVAQAMAQVASQPEDAPTGVMAIPNFRGGAAAVAVAVPPDAAATAPGSPDMAVSARVGVVPEEPENEPTRKRKGEATESTASGDKPDAMPLIAAQERDVASEEETIAHENPPGALPEAPVNERTPSVSARSPFVPEEPPHEVTIRKHGAPAPLAKQAYPPRTGTGPTGIGALGLRVNTMPRAVVRPLSNGRAASLPSPAAETQISGLHTVQDRPSGSHPAASTPWAATAAERGRKPSPLAAIPKWAFFAAGGGIVAVVGVAFLVNVVRNRPPATPTPMPTQVVEATPLETAGEPTSTAVQATPRPTTTASALAIGTPTMARTASPLPIASIPKTPIPTSTPTAVVRASPTPTAMVMASAPRPTPTAKATPKRLDVDAIIERAIDKIANGKGSSAMIELMTANRQNPNNDELLYKSYSVARAHKSLHTYAARFGKDYVAKHGAEHPENASAIKEFLTTLPPE